MNKEKICINCKYHVRIERDYSLANTGIDPDKLPPGDYCTANPSLVTGKPRYTCENMRYTYVFFNDWACGRYARFFEPKPKTPKVTILEPKEVINIKFPKPKPWWKFW